MTTAPVWVGGQSVADHHSYAAYRLRCERLGLPAVRVSRRRLYATVYVDLLPTGRCLRPEMGGMLDDLQRAWRLLEDPVIRVDARRPEASPLRHCVHLPKVPIAEDEELAALLAAVVSDPANTVPHDERQEST